MSDIFNYAVAQVERSKKAFCRFITANDANLTSHQTGFYVPKEAAEVLFDVPGKRGSNKDRFVKIRWQDDFETESRFVYYGIGGRNEYRITHFGKGFPFLDDKYVGGLLVICQMEDDEYSAVILEHDDDIDDFYSEFNLSAEKSNHLISKGSSMPTADERLESRLADIASRLTEFPGTKELSLAASQAFNDVFSITDEKILDNPDRILCEWIKTESNRNSFDGCFREGLLSLKQFIGLVQQKQSRHFTTVQ